MAEVSVKSFATPKGKIKRDAVIIHGMFSDGDAMRKFAHSLSYRKTHIPNITSFRHLYIPKIKQRSFVEDTLGPEIMKLVKKGKLVKPFDVIGHSNGGYAAIHLIDYLPKNYISRVITIATPTGFYKLTPNYSKVKQIVHVMAGKDRVTRRATIGGDACPTDSLFVFRFPDECHCSIHNNSDNNGLAEIISYMNGVKMDHSFVDDNNILHIWNWCHNEHTGMKYYKRSDVKDYDYTICDGLHMEEPTTISKEDILRDKLGKGGTPTPKKLFFDLIETHIEYLFKQRELVKSLTAINTELKLELTRLQLQNEALSEEYNSVKQEHNKLVKLEIQMQKRIKERTAQILGALNMRKEIILDNLTAAEILSRIPNISETEMQKLLNHMSIALDTYRETNHKLRNGNYNLLKA